MKPKTKTPAFVTQSIRFPGDLWKRVKAEALKKSLTVSAIVRLSLMETLGDAQAAKT